MKVLLIQLVGFVTLSHKTTKQLPFFLSFIFGTSGFFRQEMGREGTSEDMQQRSQVWESNRPKTADSVCTGSADVLTHSLLSYFKVRVSNIETGCQTSRTHLHIQAVLAQAVIAWAKTRKTS